MQRVEGYFSTRLDKIEYNRFFKKKLWILGKYRENFTKDIKI